MDAAARYRQRAATYRKMAGEAAEPGLRALYAERAAFWEDMAASADRRTPRRPTDPPPPAKRRTPPKGPD
jgi:hypothetical protein